MDSFIKLKITDLDVSESVIRSANEKHTKENNELFCVVWFLPEVPTRSKICKCISHCLWRWLKTLPG